MRPQFGVLVKPVGERPVINYSAKLQFLLLLRTPRSLLQTLTEDVEKHKYN